MTEPIHTIFFAIQFFGVIAIMGLKATNVSRWKSKEGLLYELRTSFLLFAAFFVCWAIALFIVMVDPLITLFRVLLIFENWLIVLNVLFLIIELFYYLADTALRPVKAFNSKQFYNG